MTTKYVNIVEPNGNWFKQVHILTAVGGDSPPNGPRSENEYHRHSIDALYCKGNFTEVLGCSEVGRVLPANSNILLNNCYPEGYGDWTFDPIRLHSQVTIDVEHEMAISLLRARANLIEQLRGHNWNAAIDLSQVKQLAELGTRTLHILAQSAKILHGSALRRLVSGQDRRLVLKDVSRFWLELTYGVRPAMSSAYGMSQVIDGAIRNPKPLKFRANAGRFKNLPVMCHWCVGLNIEANGSYTTSRRLIWKISPSWPGFSTFQSLGFSNPSLVIWDNIPGSFVIDWWVPVATFLEQRHLISKIDGVEINSRLSSKYVNASRGQVIPVGSGCSLGFFQGFGESFVRTVDLDRVIHPISSLNVDLPTPKSLKLPSGARIASAIALAHTNYQKLFNLFR